MKQDKPFTIPSIKQVTKKDLLKQLETLQKEKEELQDRLYESGVESRPTLISQIEEIEDEANEQINEIITHCEKLTGRPFPLRDAFFS